MSEKRTRTKKYCELCRKLRLAKFYRVTEAGELATYCTTCEPIIQAHQEYAVSMREKNQGLVDGKDYFTGYNQARPATRQEALSWIRQFVK